MSEPFSHPAGDGVDVESRFAELNEATLAVRDLIAASQELVGRMARLTSANATDMAAIGILIQFGPMGAVELGRRLAIRSASATVLVDRLERAGHAVRSPDPHDRRRVTVTATPRARELNLAAWLPVTSGIDAVAHDLDETELQTVTRFLARVTAAIERGGRADVHTDTGD